MSLRAALYLRVSTEDQANEGFSISSQKEYLETFCKSQGWEIFNYYIDDGFSGKNLERPAIKRLLKDAGEEKFNIALVYRLDRFSRRAVDLHKIVEDVFEPRNIHIKSATEPLDTFSIAGRLMLSMLVAFAQFERESIAERVKLNMLHKAKNGDWCGGGQSPFGYKNENKKLLVIPHEAGIVKRIYKEYTFGKGIRQIASELNDTGLRTRRGNYWSSQSVRNILINPEYAGYMVWNRVKRTGSKSIKRPRKDWVIVPGTQEALIEKDLFKKVQELIKERRREPGKKQGKYCLSGLVYCSRCGSKYRGWFWTNKISESTVRYYRCSGYQQGLPCKNKSINADQLEKRILSKIGEKILNKDLVLEAYQKITAGRDQMVYLNKYLLRYKEDLKNAHRKKEKIIKAYENGILTPSELNERVRQINYEKEELKKSVKEIETSISNQKAENISYEEALQAIQNADYLWSKSDISDLKTLIATVLKKVIVHENNTVEIEYL